MEAKDIPFFAVLIFPGFFAIQAFFWSAHTSKMSDLMRIVWSFLYSAAIFFGLHGFFRHVLSLGTENLPAPETMASSAADAPIWFLLSLYVGAILVGYGVGHAWHGKILDKALLALGLDLRRHRDVFGQALGQESYIDVKLRDKTLLRGFPFISSTKEESQRFVYLVQVLAKDSKGNWQKAREVLIPLEAIECVYFLNPRRPLFQGKQ